MLFLSCVCEFVNGLFVCYFLGLIDMFLLSCFLFYMNVIYVFFFGVDVWVNCC